MAIIVQKYGGSSVANVEKLRRVADRVARTRQAGHDVVVVVSAMGDTTDELLSLARQVCESPSRRELDMLLSTGERISMALLSMALNARGVPAVSFTGSQSGIITNDNHTNARIIEVRPFRVQDELARGQTVIVAGYQGVSYRREVTTLGRGGSDTTAVALAAALDAQACEIYSDVDGVYTADPRVVPEARRLAEISYEEMQQLAEAGAKVLNVQAVEFARERGIAIFARAAAGGDGETVVRRFPPSTGTRVAGVTSEKDLVLLTCPSARGDAALTLLEEWRVVPKRVTQDADAGGLSVLLSLENLHDFPALSARLTERLGEAPRLRSGLASVTVVGAGIGASLAHVTRARRLANETSSTVVAFWTSPLHISALVPAETAPALVRLWHTTFLPPESPV
jgi:aspartate kinase